MESFSQTLSVQSANALKKCYKAEAISTTHNTQRGNIEKFESIIDICISRNYLRIRMNATILSDFKSLTHHIMLPTHGHHVHVLLYEELF